MNKEDLMPIQVMSRGPNGHFTRDTLSESMIENPYGSELEAKLDIMIGTARWCNDFTEEKFNKDYKFVKGFDRDVYNNSYSNDSNLDPHANGGKCGDPCCDICDCTE